MGTSNNTQPFTSIGLALLVIISAVTATPVSATTPTPVTTTTTTNVYDDYGNPTSITVAVTDGTETFTTSTTNTYTNDTSNWYLGRLTRAEVTQTIPGTPNPVSETRISSFAYNANGLLSQEVIEPDTPALRLQTDYGYDVFGNKTTVTVSGGTGATAITSRTTTTAYDARGQFATSVTNALNHVETRTYDARYGVMLTLEGPNQLTTTWFYDSFGRQTKETRADGTETTITREWCNGFLDETGNGNCPTGGALALTTQTDGAPTSVAYSDVLGREIRVETEGFAPTGQTAEAIYVDTIYDTVGRVDKKSRPYFASTLAANIKWHTFTYDDLSRPLTETSPDGSVETTTYNGLTTSVTNDKLQVNARTKNARGELVQTVDADSNITDYRYDAFGNLVWLEDALGNLTENDYDIRGRKIWMDDPDMGYWTYDYNALGELISQTDAKLHTVSMTYDLLGRMLTRVEAEGTTTWTYDTTSDYAAGQAAHSIGKLISVDSAEGKDETYTFDTLGRLVSTNTIIDGVPYTTEQTYDLDGRLDTITYPDSYHHTTGFQVSNVYNPEGYLEKVTNFGGTTEYWTATAQNAEGQLTAYTYGNQITTTRSYDANTGLLTGIGTHTQGAGNNNIQDLRFKFDTLGNLEYRYDCRQDLSETFLYDALNRMESSTLGEVDIDCNNDPFATQTTKTYTYNEIGNIITKTGIGTYTYGAGSAGPHAVTSVNAHNFSYDANGNMTSSWNFTQSASRTIAYNSYNKPNQITQGSNTLTFSYGANREQFKQVVSTATSNSTRTYINGYYEIDKNLTTNTTTHIHYIKAGGSTVAMYKSKDTNIEETRYLHKDHLGSITEITDHITAAVVESLSYDPHGKRRETDWKDALSQIVGQQLQRCFTGHQFLDEVGLIHMGGRVYDPDLGRFLSPDPFVQEPTNAQNLNRYSYVLNNPLSYTDPSGFFFKKIFKSIAKVFKSAVKAVAKVVKFVHTNPITQSLRTIAAGAICGPQCAAASSALNTAINGGSLSDIVKSAAITYATGEAFEGLHGWENGLQKVVAHGVVGGVSSELRGGKFLSGFLSAGTVQGFSQLRGFEALGIKGPGTNLELSDRIHNAIAAAAIGGTSSVLGGGKFQNGAIAGAFSRLFNDLYVSPNAKAHVKELRKRSPSADKILSDMDADKGTLYNIQMDDLPSLVGGGLTKIQPGSKPSFFGRIFRGEEAGRAMVIMSVDHANLEILRTMAHEIGHGETYRRGGYVGFVQLNNDAVHIENKIARELDPNAYIRPIESHGDFHGARRF